MLRSRTEELVLGLMIVMVMMVAVTSTASVTPALHDVTPVADDVTVTPGQPATAPAPGQHFHSQRKFSPQGGQTSSADGVRTAMEPAQESRESGRQKRLMPPGKIGITVPEKSSGVHPSAAMKKTAGVQPPSHADSRHRRSTVDGSGVIRAGDVLNNLVVESIARPVRQKRQVKIVSPSGRIIVIGKKTPKAVVKPDEKKKERRSVEETAVVDPSTSPKKRSIAPTPRNLARCTRAAEKITDVKSSDKQIPPLVKIGGYNEAVKSTLRIKRFNISPCGRIMTPKPLVKPKEKKKERRSVEETVVVDPPTTPKKLVVQPLNERSRRSAGKPSGEKSSVKSAVEKKTGATGDLFETNGQHGSKKQRRSVVGSAEMELKRDTRQAHGSPKSDGKGWSVVKSPYMHRGPLYKRPSWPKPDPLRRQRSVGKPSGVKLNKNQVQRG